MKLNPSFTVFWFVFTIVFHEQLHMHKKNTCLRSGKWMYVYMESLYV